MLDIKFVREHLDEVRQMLKNRCNPLNLDDFEGLDKKRRELLQESEALKSQRNTVSKEISVMKKNKEDAEAKILEMRAVGAKISELDKELKDVEAQLRDIMLHIPNMPREDVPIGKDDTENPEVRKWGEPTKFDFEPKAHWDLGTELDILDADRAAKVTGARFTFYKGLGARLERACINFMMDLHANKHGYTEMLAPYIANKESMTGTGQLPKFAEDMFRVERGTSFSVVAVAEGAMDTDDARAMANAQALLAAVAAFARRRYIDRAVQIGDQMGGHPRKVGQNWVVFIGETHYAMTLGEIEGGYSIVCEGKRYDIVSDWLFRDLVFRGTCNGQRHAEDGVCAELRLGRRTVERDHGLVDTHLVGNVHADDGRGDHLVDILDGVQYALAQVTALVAVAELERFVLARRCAARNGCAAECAGYGTYFDLDGRVTSRIEDFSCMDLYNLHSCKRLNLWFEIMTSFFAPQRYKIIVN